MKRKFTLVLLEYSSGEPQAVMSCDICRLNMFYPAHIGWTSFIQWADSHICPKVRTVLPMELSK